MGRKVAVCIGQSPRLKKGRFGSVISKQTVFVDPRKGTKTVRRGRFDAQMHHLKTLG